MVMLEIGALYLRFFASRPKFLVGFLPIHIGKCLLDEGEKTLLVKGLKRHILVRLIQFPFS